MTQEEFFVAARKGQGRAIAALRRGEIQPSLHDLRRLVIRWPGFDWQCESRRGWYTAEIIEASVHRDQLKDLLLRHLVRVKGTICHRGHRIAGVSELAKRGDASAREALYACVDLHGDFRIADEIVEVDGLAGVEWILEHSGDRLIPGDTWQFDGWLDDLRESLGEAAVAEWLVTAVAKWSIVGEFVRVAEERLKRPRRGGRSEPKISFEELREEFFSDDPRTWRRSRAHCWVAQATEEEQKRAWAALVSEEDPEWLRTLGRALQRKPKFADIDKVIARARAWNDERNPYVSSMETVADPRLRQLGFDLIASGWPVDGISLFRRNFQSGDESTLLNAAHRLADDWDRHSVALDFLDIPLDHVHPDLLLWTYENNPCSSCRESAMRHLDEVAEVPLSILEEALLDCDEDTRSLAQKRSKPTVGF